MEPIISIILLLTPVAVFILLALKNLLDILKFKNIKEIVRDTDFLKLLGIPVGIILVLILIGYFKTEILFLTHLFSGYRSIFVNFYNLHGWKKRR